MALKSVHNHPSLWLIFLTFLSAYRPFNTYLLTNLTNATAELNETIYLMSSAEANPAAKYRLYKGNKSIANITATSQNIGVYATSVSDRVKEVVFKCIPFNSFGDGPTKNVTVTLHCKYMNQYEMNYVNFSWERIHQLLIVKLT